MIKRIGISLLGQCLFLGSCVSSAHAQQISDTKNTLLLPLIEQTQQKYGCSQKTTDAILKTLVGKPLSDTQTMPSTRDSVFSVLQDFGIGMGPEFCLQAIDSMGSIQITDRPRMTYLMYGDSSVSLPSVDVQYMNIKTPHQARIYLDSYIAFSTDFVQKSSHELIQTTFAHEFVHTCIDMSHFDMSHAKKYTLCLKDALLTNDHIEEFVSRALAIQDVDTKNNLTLWTKQMSMIVDAMIKNYTIAGSDTYILEATLMLELLHDFYPDSEIYQSQSSFVSYTKMSDIYQNMDEFLVCPGLSQHKLNLRHEYVQAILQEKKETVLQDIVAIDPGRIKEAFATKFEEYRNCGIRFIQK